MPKLGEHKNLVGETFGRWLVLRHEGQGSNPNRRESHWLCRCQCGQDKVVKQSHLLSGRSRSCGCLRRETTGRRATTHGQFGSATYGSWSAMNQRCFTPGHKDFAHYGGRGISVCAEWQRQRRSGTPGGFARFLADMGERPEGTTLDRVDVNGNYELRNCRWSTASEQRANQRSSAV